MTDNLNIENVEHLGLLNRADWHALLLSAKFVLGFGKPHHGPTILESLSCRAPLIAPKSQIPASMHSCANIYLTDDMENEDILKTIQQLVWNEPNDVENSILSSQEYVNRVRSIFKF